MSTPATTEPASGLPLAKIDPDHWPNPRGPIDTTSAKYRELQGSIAAQGILEPIVVGPPMLKGDRHPIIAGWRRYTAASAAELEHVPVHVRADITTEHQALRAALAENMAREDMTPLAEARSLKRLMDLGDTQAAAAKALGISERTARERLRLLSLPAAVRDAIDSGSIPTTAGRQLQLIADVSPKAAGTIAKRITAGSLRAGALLVPQLTRQALADVAKPSGLVQLQSNTPIARLPLKPEVRKTVKARARKAAEHSYSADYLDLSPTAIGKPLISEARAAGKILAIPGEHGEALYLGDPAWIERATLAAVERAEKRAADRKRERERQRDKQDTRAAQDPAERARREHEREQAALDKHAQPFAAAMNAELGARLRDLRSCPIEGAVARLLLHLTLDHQYLGPIARQGYMLVDPEHRYATCADKDTHTIVDDDVRGADSPEAAAAILVAAQIAFLYADVRGRDGKRTHMAHYMHDDTTPLVRAVADELGVLPDRAKQLDEARRTFATARAYHAGESERRRVLHELTKTRKGLHRDALYAQCKEFSSDVAKLGAAVHIWQHHALDRALEQLTAAGLVDADGADAQRLYRVNADGRRALKTPLPPAPLFPAIDAQPDPEPAPAPDATQAARPRRQRRAAAAAATAVIVHVTPTHGGGDPVEAELQPDRQAGRPNVRIGLGR